MLRILKDKGLGRYPILAEVLSKRGHLKWTEVNEDKAYNFLEASFSWGCNIIPLIFLPLKKKDQPKS